MRNGKTRAADRYHGVLLIDKPLRLSSHDVVQVLRRTLHQRRIGHAGTLDPLAEGLLVVCVGRGTKIVQFLTGFEKTYEAEICLGRTSVTFDGEGVDLSQPACAGKGVTEKEVLEVLARFTGRITQRVPAYSAVRVNGEPLYKKARRGEEVSPPEREVEVSEIRLLKFEHPHVAVEVRCSSGTYIRTLADDIGRDLGCGGYLSRLRRTRVGHLQVSDALSLDQAAEAATSGQLEAHILGYGDVLRYSALWVTDAFRPHVIEGRTPLYGDFVGCEGQFAPGDTVLLKSNDGAVLAVGRAGIGSTELGQSTAVNHFDYIRVLN